MKAYIGTSGWQHGDWKDVFYPEGLAGSEKLAYYARQFTSVEVNSTFYHIPRPATCMAWAAAVPEDFVFTIKLNRLFTHQKKLLLDAQGLEKLKIFMASLALLGKKLGCLLVQLPPSLKRDDDKLAEFAFALRQVMASHGITCKVALEVRNASWYENEASFKALLESLDWLHVINDSPGRWPSAKLAADAGVYIRLHGNRELYKSAYTLAELAACVNFVDEQKPKVTYVYCNNTIAAAAVRNAQMLQRLLG